MKIMMEKLYRQVKHLAKFSNNILRFRKKNKISISKMNCIEVYKFIMKHLKKTIMSLFSSFNPLEHKLCNKTFPLKS